MPRLRRSIISKGTRVETSAGARMCNSCRRQAKIQPDDRFLLVKGKSGYSNYCTDCAWQVLDDASHEIAKLKRDLHEMCDTATGTPRLGRSIISKGTRVETSAGARMCYSCRKRAKIQPDDRFLLVKGKSGYSNYCVDCSPQVLDDASHEIAKLTIDLHEMCGTTTDTPSVEHAENGQKMEDTERVGLLKAAIDYLASRCDGAHCKDGQGFNAAHSALGRSLAGLSEDHWTPSDTRKAWQILHTYTGQLADAGIVYAEIPKPPVISPRLIDVRDSKFVFVFEYDAGIVNAIRELPRRSFDGDSKEWSVPVSPRTIIPVAAFADEHNFETSDGAKHVLAEAADTTPPPDKSIRLADGTFVFDFDYDAKIVSSLRALPNMSFERDPEPLWRVPVTATAATTVLHLAEEFHFTLQDGVKEAAERASAEVRKNIEASRAHTSDFDVAGLGGTLRPFQRAGVAYAVEMKHTFLADEMGLGKTIQALATLEATNSYPALIICPASVKLNWLRETQFWLPHRTATVFESFPLEHHVTIINYDQLTKLVNKSDNPRKEVAGKLKACVLDESQYIKNQKAKRSARAKALGRDVPMRLCLTGTPVLNRPQELISQLEFLDRLDQFGGFWGFAKRFCNPKQNTYGYDFSGSDNLEELNTRLRATCYIRRRKAEVLTELPPKQRTIVPVDITNRPEYSRARTKLIAWIRENAAKDEVFLASIAHLPLDEMQAQVRERANSAAERARRAEQLVRIGKLKQLAATGKMNAVEQWVETFLESGEKLVIFAHHQTIVGELTARFSADSISGSTSPVERQQAVDRFQDDPTRKLIVCNIRSAGVGITLTAASNVCFVELDWTPAAHDQAEDRCHRITQESSVNAWYLLADKTIDTDIYELIEAKRTIVDAATEGDGDASDFSILRELRERLTRTDRTGSARAVK